MLEWKSSDSKQCGHGWTCWDLGIKGTKVLLLLTQLSTYLSLRSKHALGWFRVCVADKHTHLAGVEDFFVR